MKFYAALRAKTKFLGDSYYKSQMCLAVPICDSNLKVKGEG